MLYLLYILCVNLLLCSGQHIFYQFRQQTFSLKKGIMTVLANSIQNVDPMISECWPSVLYTEPAFDVGPLTEFLFNPLNTDDASQHHFASLKNHLISYTLELKFPWNCSRNNNTFFHKLSPTFESSHLRPLQVENCDSNSRIVVDEDYNGKLRLERVTSVLLRTRIIDRTGTSLPSPPPLLPPIT